MRDSDNFAFGPVRGKARASTRLEHVRTWTTYTVRGWRALAGASALVSVALVVLPVAWTFLTVAVSRRAASELRSRWTDRYRARHRSRATLLSLSAPGRHRITPVPGRHRGPSLVPTFAAVGRHRSEPAIRPTVAGAVRRAAGWQPRAIHFGRLGVRSRRLTTVLAAMMSVFILGGLLPVQAAPNDITTIAGRPDSGDGAAATSALVHLPRDVATDAAGNVYIADTYNHRVRKVSTAGTITTIAGNGTSGFSGDGGPATSAQLRFPEGVWVDTAGNVYIADSGNDRVRTVSTAGVITTIAGNGTSGFSGDGGPATAAQLNDPKDITTDDAGNLYIADNENHRIRRVSAGGTITTYAGNGVEGYAGDSGPATSARLNDPTGVAYNNSETQLYISDTDNNRIRRVNPAGQIATYVGTGTPGDVNHPQLTKSQIDSPERIESFSGGLLVADTDNDKVKFVTSAVSTVAGSGTPGFSGDGGGATGAQLNQPTGVAGGVGGAFRFYVADSGNHRVRRVSSGIITTYAGRNHFGGDGGPGTDGALNRPFGLAADSAGNLVIADTENHRVRRLSGGVLTTVAGTGTRGFSGDGGSALSANLDSPYDVAVDTAGNVYIADTLNDRVRKVNPAGNISTLAGTGTPGFSGDGGQATSAQLDTPLGLDVDAAGNVYIADLGNHRIRRVTPGGTITTVAGSATGGFCGDGGPATSACLDNPTDVEVDAAGNLYIAVYGSHRIRKVTAGIIRTVAGNGSAFHSGDGGPATSAGLSQPVGLAVDGAGNLYIASSGSNRIRKVDAAGVITTVAGNGTFGFAGDGGPATSGELAFPARVALDAEGNFYIADVFNNRIRMVEALGSLPGPTMGGTTPVSPANDNTPFVYGTAEPSTTVRIYTNATCTGPVAATGTDGEFAAPGLAVSVADDSTTAFYATATNGSGQVSGCSMTPVTYIEDSTPPAPPTITLEPASPGSDLSPSWSFSTDAGAEAECELSSSTATLVPYAPCTSPASFDLTGQPDDIYTFSVRATDVAGNTGTPATDGYVLDSTQPGAPTITVSPPTPSDGLSPTWEFSVEPGSTAECEFSYQGTILQAFALCDGPQQFDLTGQPDGDYTFRVQARDGADNPSAPVGSVYSLDTTDPGPPTIDSGPTSPGSSTSPGWTFTVDPGSGAECQLRRGGTVVSDWQACSSPDVHDLSGEPDGDYDFLVRAVDAAGNTGSATTSGYTLDTTGPDVNITASPSTPDSDPTVSWTFATDPGASPECELRRAGSVVYPFGPCSSPQDYDLTALPDGDYEFSVRASDAAGNTGAPASSIYVLDTTPPVVNIDSAPAPFSSERNPEWGFSSEAGVSYECELSDAGGVLQAFTPCTSPQPYDLSSASDGTYTFRVRATDAAANLGPASSSSYTLDTSGPASSVTSSPSSPGSTQAPSWSFTVEAGASAQCELSGPSGILSPYTPCVSPHSYNLTGQVDGGYTFSVRATDAAGNTGAPSSNTYTLDRTPPSASITSSPPSPSSSLLPTWAFTTEAGASTQCELSRGGVTVSPWASCASPKTYSLSGQPDGTYTFRVRATDAAGNTGPAETGTYALDTTGPLVTVSGPASPGNGQSPSWSFSTESGASAECELARGGLILQPFAPCTSPATYDLTVQPDGVYTVRVRATDSLGNTGPMSSADYELDTGGPATTITSAPASPGSSTSVSWAFITEAGASTACELSGPGGVIQAFSACASPEGLSISGGADGAYTFKVRATDDAGNTGATASSTYTLDTTPPAVPAITGSPSSPGSAEGVSWSFTSEPGTITECELRTTSSSLHGFVPCTSPHSESLPAGTDGDYTFAVRAVDSLGNTSASASSSYTLDTTGPEVTFSSEPKSPDKDRNPTWTFEVEAGASTACALSSGGSVLFDDATCSSPVSFNLNGEPDGTYTLRVNGTDVAGNEGPPAGSKYELDTVEPEPEKVEEPPAQPAPRPDQPSDAPDEASEPAPAPEPDRRPVRRDGPAEEPSEEVQEVAPEPDEARETSESMPRAGGALGEFLENVGTVAAGLLEQPAFPLSLISVVFGFLVLQNRVDRRDPKLAMAPVYPDPHLYFQPQEGPGKVHLRSGEALKGPMT